ncbi:ShlB/FhaC/HecB family hemolysin secretion/activation protein [Caulobacter sp.]|uniref:ShlB/FhaC/HecB family hemolysin secretion/activation protein n=1 Tax=Caulobacter sp. TaxID=78 RepID=UPI001B232622|nr:ShlB/FhaC/HecB family hemolysin secretion/activation protein [Caulobacter sp.]MBO9545763.1 hypothetical protein [Caulobacter sp.]
MTAAWLALTPAHAMAADETRLRVQLKIVDGRFAADAESKETRLEASETFGAEYRQTQDQVEKRLIADLNRVLATTDKAATLDGASCAPASPRDEAVCTIKDASWGEASEKFSQWIAVRDPEYGGEGSLYLSEMVLVGRLLGKLGNNDNFQRLLEPTALLWEDPGGPDADLDAGRLNFIVRRPIASQQIQACDKDQGDCVVGLGKNAAAFDGRVSQRAMARSLRPLRGSVWNLARIHRQLGDLLHLAGFPSTTSRTPARDEAALQPLHAGEVPPSLDPTSTVVVDGPSPVAALQFAFPLPKSGEKPVDAAAEEASILKALYLMLPDQAFRAVQRDPTLIISSGDQAEGPASKRYRTFDLPTAPGAVIYADQMAPRLKPITALGFEAGFVDDSMELGGARLWTRVQIEPRTDDKAKDGEKPKDGQEVKLVPITIEPRHKLSVGVDAQPHKPTAAFIEYHQAKLLGDDTIDLRVGSRGKAIISGAYEKDFVGFPGFRKRLSLSVQGASDYTPDVPNGTARADERRTGASVGAQLEMFRDWNDQALRLNAAFSYEDVTLDTGAGAAPPPATRTSRVTLGADYVWIGREALNRPNITLEPSITRAWGEGSTPSYWQGALRGVAHDSFETFFEYDGRLALDWASDRTPVTELPRLGGGDSLRGLRSDAAAGTFVWSVQNEIWVPLRFTERFGRGVDGILRNSLKLAAFIDIGGADNNRQDLPSFNAGLGLGLRLKPSDAVAFRLDWAHLATRAPRGMSDQSIYFSITVIP